MLTRILDVYTAILTKLIVLLMIALTFSVALQIVGRYIPFIPRYLWTEEVARFSLIWTIFLGAMIGVREKKHFYVNFLPQNLSPKAETVLQIIYYVFMFTVSFIFVRFGYRYVLMGYVQESDITGLNLAFIYGSVPLSGITWFLFLIEGILNDFFSSSTRRKEAS
ncbi:MAG: TRAP transporter small permease [bacterium]|nr:TRAP transporter small permease [bacterium]